MRKRVERSKIREARYQKDLWSIKRPPEYIKNWFGMLVNFNVVIPCVQYGILVKTFLKLSSKILYRNNSYELNLMQHGCMLIAVLNVTS